MAMIGENLPYWAVKIVWLIGFVFLAIRSLLVRIPFVCELVFWLYKPHTSADEAHDFANYQASMLKAEKNFDAAVGVDIQHRYFQVNVDADNKPVYLHVATCGDENKPMMVLLHGFPEYWLTYRHLMKEFSKDYFVVVPDQRGYNISSKPRRFTDYSVDVLIADIETLVTQCLQRSECVLCAHDWGGNIGWYIAHHYDFVTRLIMLNMPHPALMGKHLRQGGEQSRRSLYILWFQLPRIPEGALTGKGGSPVSNIIGKSLVKSKLTGTEREAFAHAATRPGAMTAALNWYRAVLDGAGSLRRWKRKQIDIPTLFLYGVGDVAFDPAWVSEEAHKKYCSNLKFVPIENCSHWIQNDQPKRVIEEMRKFLS